MHALFSFFLIDLVTVCYDHHMNYGRLKSNKNSPDSAIPTFCFPYIDFAEYKDPTFLKNPFLISKHFYEDVIGKGL